MNNINTQIEQLFKLGAHLGHKTNRVHPKAKKYIYTIQNGVSIIDLTKTVDLLKKAKEFITKTAKERKTLLIVFTKKTANPVVFDLCQKNNIPVITVKWPAGLLTNFENIIKNVEKLKAMKEEKESGRWENFTKHEQVKLNKHLRRLEKFYGGILNLKKIPDVIFIVDIKKEKNAVKEAQRLGIPIVAVVDTNSDPTSVAYPIPANDDSTESANFFVNEIIEAYKTGLKISQPEK